MIFAQYRKLTFDILFAILSIAFIIMESSVIKGLKPWVTNDYFTYAETSKHSIISSRFLISSRTPTLPLIHKLLGRNNEKIMRFQIYLTAVSHIILAGVFFYFLGAGVLGLLSAISIYLYALSPPVYFWSIAMLSESVCFSFSAILISTFILFIHIIRKKETRNWQIGLIGALFIISASLYSLTKDNLAYQLPFFIALILLFTAIPQNWRSLTFAKRVASISSIVALAIVFYFQIYSSVKAGRWHFCFQNVLFDRVYLDENVRKSWSEKYHIPTDSDVLDIIKRRNINEFRKNKKLEKWIYTYGLKSYKNDIIHNPNKYMEKVLIFLITNINDHYQFSGAFTKYAIRLNVSKYGEYVIFVKLKNCYPFILFSLAISILLCISLLSKSSLSSCSCVVLILMLTFPSQAAIIYLADSMEENRHFLPVTIIFRLTLILTFWITIASIKEIYYKIKYYISNPKSSECRRVRPL